MKLPRFYEQSKMYSLKTRGLFLFCDPYNSFDERHSQASEILSFRLQEERDTGPVAIFSQRFQLSYGKDEDSQMS